MAHPCPNKCGKKFISAEHAGAHADQEHPDWRTPKRKGWCFPDIGFIDFAYPVTEAEARAAAGELKGMFGKTAAPKPPGESA